MGSKSKILYYTVLLVNVVCFFLDFLPINFPFFRISFAVTLVLIGLLLMARAVSLKIDSSLFIGTLLLIFGVLNAISYFGQVHFDLNINELWPYYLFAVAASSFVTSVYFKDKLQGKICVLFLGFGLITLIFVQNIITLWWFVGFMIAWFIAYFTVNILISRRRG